MQKLKKGYTTGVHTSFAFKAALEAFLYTSNTIISKSKKSDNDDLDVTKGAVIVVTISLSKNMLNLNPIKHNPYIFQNNNTTLQIYAAKGVGVVTKDGLKPPKNYPAINPIPLQSLQNIFNLFKFSHKIIYCSIGVENGENIALKTANSKVGVIGGISILGTTGWVKPISSIAYLNSIETELNFAKSNNIDTIIFTLGNNSLQKAKQLYKNHYIIEIGNFIYDGISLAIKKNFSSIILICGIAKAVKISQGFKNTHNRFGSIDFNNLQQYIDVNIQHCVTIKRVLEILNNKQDIFIHKIKIEAQQQLKYWFNKNIQIIIA